MTSAESEVGLIMDRNSSSTSEKPDQSEMDLESGIHRPAIEHSIYEYLRWPHLKKICLFSSIIFSLVLIMCAVALFSVYEVYHNYGVPTFFLIGNLTGNLSADFGTLGVAELQPHFYVNLKVS